MDNIFKINTVSLLTILALSACNSHKFDVPQTLGGITVEPKVLNLGYDVYQNNCMQCHGQAGDGKGPASYGQNPPPRDFTQGLFKFQSTSQGELPTDADLKKTIRYGLSGTGMLPWDISEERLEAVIQYIKTFSPAWKTQKSGDVVALGDDPFGSTKASEAIELGRKVYHGVAQCWTCHPSFASLSQVSNWSKELTGNSLSELRETPHLSVNQASSYNHNFMPPDFTKSFIKSGGEVKRIAEVLNVGVNGTTMPGWKGALAADASESDRRQWALAYYVNSLYQLKFDDQARKKALDEYRAN